MRFVFFVLQTTLFELTPIDPSWFSISFSGERAGCVLYPALALIRQFEDPRSLHHSTPIDGSPLLATACTAPLEFSFFIAPNRIPLGGLHNSSLSFEVDPNAC